MILDLYERYALKDRNTNSANDVGLLLVIRSLMERRGFIYIWACGKINSFREVKESVKNQFKFESFEAYFY